MKAWGLLAGGMALAYGATLSPTGAQSATTNSPDLNKDIKPVLQKYCAACHNVPNPPANVNPFLYKSVADMAKNPKEWERILLAIKSGHMPPKGLAQPPKAERDKLIEDIEKLLLGECKLNDPGRVTIRRLNRAEYAYTIQDLLGVRFDPTEDFPNDDVGYGFDNIGDVLTVSPLLLEKYLDAAEEIASEAIFVPGSRTQTIPANEMPDVTGGRRAGEGGYVFFSNGESSLKLKTEMGGSYRLKVRASSPKAGDEAAKMAVTTPGRRDVFDVIAPNEKPVEFEVPISLEPGETQIQIAFLNDYYQANVADRNLVVHAIELVGPIGEPTSLPATHRRLIPTRPAPGQELAHARKLLGDFASRAFRRPVRPDELERLMVVVKGALDQKERFESAMQLGVTAVLCSPNFLFRAEIDPNASGNRPLTGYELASRLSYFLWSSMPDEELTNLAAEGKLNQPAVLEQQVDRMLADEKSRRLGETFATQWLQLGKLKLIQPDARMFPRSNPQLKNDMRREALAFFNDAVRSDRSVLNFLDSDYVFVNQRLARHYRIDGVEGDHMRRVPYTGNERGGLIGMAGVLLINSNPTRTSPTKRGRWILDQILGEPPPPPPPGVDVLKPEAQTNVKRTLREQMVAHREKPECANCHARMDPLGFSLENYDALGEWRTDDHGQPVDASGELPDGSKFNGPEELRQLLLKKKDKFVHALGEKLFTFALGRGTTLADNCYLDDISERTRKSEYRFSAMIKGVVLSDAFRQRKPEPRTPKK